MSWKKAKRAPKNLPQGMARKDDKYPSHGVTKPNHIRLSCYEVHPYLQVPHYELRMSHI